MFGLLHATGQPDACFRVLRAKMKNRNRPFLFCENATWRSCYTFGKCSANKRCIGENILRCVNLERGSVCIAEPVICVKYGKERIA